MSDEFLIDWGDLPNIPEGIYEAVYVRHQTHHLTFGPKVEIVFRITSFGPYNGALISGWYNVKKLKSKPSKGGGIVLSRHSKLVNELFRVLDSQVKLRKLSLVQLKPLLLKIKVRTVKTNSRQKELHKTLQYSVVDSILESLTSSVFKPPTEQQFQNGLYKPLPEPIPVPVPT